AELAQSAGAAFRKHGRRRLGHRMKKTADAAALVADRRMRKSEKGLLEGTIQALEKHPLVFEIHGLAGERALKRLADGRPGARPGDAVVLAKRSRMHFATTTRYPSL